MAMTSCEVFADLGNPMDSRVRRDFGYPDREPSRAVYRVQPDGFVQGHVSKDVFWDNEEPDAPPPYFSPSPSEKPDADAVARLKSARLNFKKKDRRNIIVLPHRRPKPSEDQRQAHQPRHVFVPTKPVVRDRQAEAQAQARFMGPVSDAEWHRLGRIASYQPGTYALAEIIKRFGSVTRWRDDSARRL